MKNLFLILLTFLTLQGVVYSKDVDMQYENGIYHIILSGNKIKKKIKFIASDELLTNHDMHKKSKSKLTINTGFFDPNNSKTVSYIVTDGEIVAEPLSNERLLYDKYLGKNLDKVLNRSEFRILKCQNEYSAEITSHNTPVKSECSIVTSAQGGPLILPELRLEEELFIVKNKNGNIIRESCSVLHKVPRTVIGIKDEDIHLLIITDEHPMNLYEVQELCKKLEFETAMNFDGGSSTSMNYEKNIEVISTIGDGGGRKLKSFMILKK